MARGNPRYLYRINYSLRVFFLLARIQTTFFCWCQRKSIDMLILFFDQNRLSRWFSFSRQIDLFGIFNKEKQKLGEWEKKILVYFHSKKRKRNRNRTRKHTHTHSGMLSMFYVSIFILPQLFLSLAFKIIDTISSLLFESIEFE